MNRQSGVTLIELMVTLSIAVILLTIAVPSLQATITQNRVGGYATEFMGTLNLARSEAIKRGIPVHVCRSSNGSTCTGTWSDGWIVFADLDGDSAPDADEILRINEALGGNDSLASNTFAAASVIYARNGTANATGMFAFCAGNDTAGARGVIVTLTSPRFAADTDTPADGVLNNENGDDITSCSSL